MSPDDKEVYRIPQEYRPNDAYEYEYGHKYNQDDYHDHHPSARHDHSQAHLLNQSNRSAPYKSSEQSHSTHTFSTPYNPSHTYYPEDPYNLHNVHTPRTAHSHPYPPSNLPSDPYLYDMHTTATRTSASSSFHSTEDQFENAQRVPYHQYWMSDSEKHAIPLVDLANSPTTRYGGARVSNASAGFGHQGRLSGGSGSGSSSRPNTANTFNGDNIDALNSPGGEPTHLGGRLSTSTASPTVGLTPVKRHAPNSLFTYESYQQDARRTTGSHSHTGTGVGVAL